MDDAILKPVYDIWPEEFANAESSLKAAVRDFYSNGGLFDPKCNNKYKKAITKHIRNAYKKGLTPISIRMSPEIYELTFDGETVSNWHGIYIHIVPDLDCFRMAYEDPMNNPGVLTVIDF